MAEVAAKIDNLEEETVHGTFSSEGTRDILTTAIGKPDDRHHVRGEPLGTTVKSYFGSTSQNASQAQMLREMKDFKEDMMRQMEDLRKLINLEPSATQRLITPVSLNTKESGTPVVNLQQPSDPPPPPPTESRHPCYLWLELPFSRLVARGDVYNHAKLHHGHPIPQRYKRVSVTSIQPGEEHTDVPFPDNEVEILDEAIGNFTIWPINLIHSGDTPPSVESDDVKYPFLAALKNEYWRRIGQVKIPMNENIVLKDYFIIIDKKDLTDFM